MRKTIAALILGASSALASPTSPNFHITRSDGVPNQAEKRCNGGVGGGADMFDRLVCYSILCN